MVNEISKNQIIWGANYFASFYRRQWGGYFGTRTKYATLTGTCFLRHFKNTKVVEYNQLNFAWRNNTPTQKPDGAIRMAF